MPDTMSGLQKLHKQVVGSPPFRSSLSALQIPTCNLVNFLVLTKNEYTVKVFHFAEEICEQDPALSMGSLEGETLFANIPLDKTNDICINQLFTVLLLLFTDTVEGLIRSELSKGQIWLQRSLNSYLRIYCPSKLMVLQWDHLLDLSLLTYLLKNWNSLNAKLNSHYKAWS